MENKQFLEDYPIEISVSEDQLDKAKAILKEANEHYVLIYDLQEEELDNKKKRYVLKVICPRTNFGMAYFYLGWKMQILLSSAVAGKVNLEHN